jgi:hypothetical protein
MSFNDFLRRVVALTSLTLVIVLVSGPCEFAGVRRWNILSDWVPRGLHMELTIVLRLAPGEICRRSKSNQGASI